MNLLLLNLIILIYLLATIYLGYRGWKTTKDSEGYMVAGRKTHPYIMAMSYGATFISTSAIVGFGGTAGLFGMGLLWLTLLNIFVGIFIAFVIYGKRTRKMGHNLNAMTFPELLGKRFNSKFVQYFSGLVIFFGMPLYASVVLIGAARFMETTLAIDFNVALLIYSVIIAAYVVWGGLKGVMYTDALQGTIMFIGMAFLIVMTYAQLGGVTTANQALTDMAPLVPANLAAQGHTGWTSMPALGSPWWWTLISTIVMGVGIGVLAMPQLVVRFMTVKSNRELNRGVLVGGIFIIMMTGVAFVTGALSNVFFYQTEGNISINIAKGNADSIIPLYINAAMPEWFVYIFMLTLLAAAMSTSSSQFHAQGTAIGRDIYETLTLKKGGSSILITRVGVVVAIIIAVILGYLLPANIIARGTAIFFGLCASAFLSMYTLGLFWRRVTTQGAIAGLIVGTLASVFWMVFVHKSEATALGISKFIFGRDMLITQMPWPVVDPIVIALPLAFLVTVLVSLATKPMEPKHLDECFRGIK
jgi:SSS family solute:Na+ symporter